MKVTTAVAVSKYTVFDPKNPSAADPSCFALVGLDENGVFPEHWVKDGYIQVGTAEVEITLFSAEESTKNAVVALKKHKQSILADAQAKATEIERKIQSLLAITNEA